MLTLDDYKILKFEAELGELPRWRKESAIRKHFDFTSVTYYQRLSRIKDDPEAVEHYPQLVYRLQAREEARVHARAARLIARDA